MIFKTVSFHNFIRQYRQDIELSKHKTETEMAAMINCQWTSNNTLWERHIPGTYATELVNKYQNGITKRPTCLAFPFLAQHQELY
jgi:hypothetical protein